MDNSAQITIFLMNKKGLKVLKRLVELNLDNFLSKVIIGSDNSLQYDYTQEIIEICTKNQIEYSLKNGQSKFDTKFALAISWRWLINFRKNQQLIVLHDSILPKYRGFSPLVNMLLNREKQIGVTALFAQDEYDVGDIILQKRKNVTYPITISKAIDEISHLYCGIASSIIETIGMNKEIDSSKQNHQLATYSIWRDAEDYLINWNDSSTNISHFIDCVGFPYDGAKSYFNDQLVRINRAKEFKNLNLEIRHVGKILMVKNGNPIVICGEGLLEIQSMTSIQKEASLLPVSKFRSRFK